MERKMRVTHGRSCGGEHLRNNGFELGASNLALYRSELVNGFCHGDDFVTAAAEDQTEVFAKMLQDKFDTRRIGMIGAAKHLDELEVLHRSVRVINDELVGGRNRPETCSSIDGRSRTYSGRCR